MEAGRNLGLLQVLQVGRDKGCLDGQKIGKEMGKREGKACCGALARQVEIWLGRLFNMPRRVVFLCLNMLLCYG